MYANRQIFQESEDKSWLTRPAPETGRPVTNMIPDKTPFRRSGPDAPEDTEALVAGLTARRATLLERQEAIPGEHDRG